MEGDPVTETTGGGRATRKETPGSDELRQALVEAAAAGGELPPERQLVSELGVSRSRLRRVLAEMRNAGELPPAQLGRRTSRDGNPGIDALAKLANPTDVIELRVILEPQLARLAAIRSSAIETGRILRAATSGSDEEYGAADLTFHREIAGASRNPLARELYNILRQVGTDARVRLPSRRPPCEKRRAARDAEHLRIARAIADRDPEGAEVAMRAHLGTVHSLIIERLSPDPVELQQAAGAAQ